MEQLCTARAGAADGGGHTGARECGEAAGQIARRCCTSSGPDVLAAGVGHGGGERGEGADAGGEQGEGDDAEMMRGPPGLMPVIRAAEMPSQEFVREKLRRRMGCGVGNASDERRGENGVRKQRWGERQRETERETETETETEKE